MYIINNMEGRLLMINKLNKILGKYHVELKEGITANARFLSKNDLKKIAKLDKTILIDIFIEPSVADVLIFKEGIFVNALITYKNETLFVHIEGIYIPLDLTYDRFNAIIDGMCYRPPSRFYKVEEDGVYYLYCWWDKIW